MARRMLPVNVATLDFSGAPKPLASTLASRIRAGNYEVAQSLAELTSEATESSFVDVTVAAKVGLVVAEAALNVGYRVFVHEYQKFKDYQEEDEVVRVGVGIRYVFTVEMMDFNLQVNGLAGLAAAAELNMARASTSYRVIGVHGRTITTLHPRAIDTLNVDSYPKVIETIDRIREHIYDADGGVLVSPEVLAVSSTEAGRDPLTPENFVRVGTMQCIVQGYSLEGARHELIVKRRVPDHYRGLIEQVYTSVAKESGERGKPSHDVIESTKRLLLGVD